MSGQSGYISVLVAVVLSLASCFQSTPTEPGQTDATADIDGGSGISDGAVEAQAEVQAEVADDPGAAQRESTIQLRDSDAMESVGVVSMSWLDDFQISGLMLVFVLLLGALVYAVMRWARNKVRGLALSKPRRALFNRVRPLVEAVVTVLYVVVSVRLILGDSPMYSTIVLALFTLGLISISWFAIRDVVAGMLVKASEICLPGDYIEIGDTSGRVRGLGYRVIALDTSDGGQAFIPYGRISRETLIRKPVTDGVNRHNFQLQLEHDVEVVEAKAAIRRSALNSHWHSVVRDPQIDVDESNVFTVTVFALAENQGHRIEASVREALEASPPKCASSETEPRLPRSTE